MLLGLHAARLRRQRNFLAMLVSAGDEGDALALQPLKPGQGIGRYGGVGTTHVRRCSIQSGWRGGRSGGNISR